MGEIYDYYMGLVKRNGVFIKAVPRDIIDEAMCEAAVENMPRAIRYIDEDNITDYMVRVAVDKSEKNRKYVKGRFLDVADAYISEKRANPTLTSPGRGASQGPGEPGGPGEPST